MAVALLVPILCALAPARAPADEPPPGAWLKRWMNANLEKLVGLTGLRFDVSGAWSSGTDLSLDIGNTFTVA